MRVLQRRRNGHVLGFGVGEDRSEVGLGLGIDISRREGLCLFCQHQRRRIDRRLHRGARCIGAAVVDRGAAKAHERHQGQRERGRQAAAVGLQEAAELLAKTNNARGAVQASAHDPPTRTQILRRRVVGGRV